MAAYTFKKAERLKSRKKIKRLFAEGKSFAVYPLRVVWTEEKDEHQPFPVQFALTVPKKKFSKAAHRNRLRRRIREAWRLNKQQLYQKCEKSERFYSFMIIYTAAEELPYTDIEKAMKKIISRFR
ncbi:MAG: ribonuclease P protein component, partial [Bacteroidota bacterium]